MTGIRNKPGGRPAKSRIDKQNRVVSTKLTELQFYAIRKRATEAGLRVSEYVRQAVVSAEVTPRDVYKRQILYRCPVTVASVP